MPYVSAISFACVPLPAPGGPNSTMGPTTCWFVLTPTAADVCTSMPRTPNPNLRPFLARRGGPLPRRPAPANTPAARGETLIMTHHQLRLDLIDRVHGHAYDDQQRGPAKVEVHTQSIGHPGRQAFEECSDGTKQMIEVNARDHPFRNEGDQDQVQRAYQGDARQNIVDVVGRPGPGPDARNESTRSEEHT